MVSILSSFEVVDLLRNPGCLWSSFSWSVSNVDFIASSCRSSSCSDDSPEPANKSIPSREDNINELEAISYAQPSLKDIGSNGYSNLKTATDERMQKRFGSTLFSISSCKSKSIDTENVPNQYIRDDSHIESPKKSRESLDSIENRHKDDSIDNEKNRKENIVQSISSSKDELEKQGRKKIPTLSLRRFTFKDIHAHIPTYSPFVHEFDKLVKKVLVNGATKLQTLGPRLKRLKIPEKFNKAIISGNSNTVNCDIESIKRKSIRRSPKKRGRKKLSKSILLEKKFTYRIIKFTHKEYKAHTVPHKSPPSTPTSTSEKYKNSSKVPEHYPNLRSTVQIISKVQNEKVIEKTIIGQNRSRKRKNKSPNTKHSKVNTNQSIAFEQRSSPTTSSTSPSRKRRCSLKEHFFPDTISHSIEVATSLPNCEAENTQTEDTFFRDDVNLSEITQDPRQDICRISRVESWATIESENIAPQNSKPSSNGSLEDVNTTNFVRETTNFVRENHSEVQPINNDVETQGAEMSNLMSNVYIPIKDTNIIRTHIHDPDINILENSPPDIKQEDDPFMLELEFSESP